MRTKEDIEHYNRFMHKDAGAYTQMVELPLAAWRSISNAETP